MKWVNCRVVEQLATLNVDDEPTLLHLFAHIVLAEQIYLERVSERDPFPQNFWQRLTLAECSALIEENYARYYRMLDKLNSDTLRHTVAYRNSAGERVHTPVCDLLTHVFQHSTYHRGQIALRLGATNDAAPITEYIAFTRT